jgi:hypothetical protein
LYSRKSTRKSGFDSFSGTPYTHGFYAQNEVHPVVDQVADVRAVAGQAVLDDDELQMRMLPADFGQEPLRRVPLAVVFGGAVLFLDRLGRQRDHLLDVGMHDHRPQHLVLVGHAAVLVLLHLTGLAVDRRRGEISGAIQRQQVGAGVENERLQGLAPLQLAEDVAISRPQVLGVHRVENLPHPRVAGNLADAEQGIQIGIAATVVEGQQRGVLQREHGEGRHQGVGQGNRRIGAPRIGDLGETAANQGIEGIRRQVLATLLLGIRRRGKDHGDSFRPGGMPSWRSHAPMIVDWTKWQESTCSWRKLYENTPVQPPISPGVFTSPGIAVWMVNQAGWL